MRTRISLWLLLACGIALPWWSGPRCHGDEVPAEPVKIGMVETFFQDVPKSTLDWLPFPFNLLMKEQTGLEGKLLIGGDYHHVAKLLNDKTIDLGVFHGFEFAWAQSRFPNLRPLMIAIYKQHGLRANLVVLKDHPAKSFDDLKGKDLALPMNSKGHCRVFLDRSCRTCAQAEPKDFFKQITRPDNVLVGLDDVVDGKVQAAVVDSESLEIYQNLKPGYGCMLKVAVRSVLFPSAVLAYRPGTVAAPVLEQIREGMTKANESVRSRDLMLMFKIGAFEPPPDNYSQLLADIMKVYPAPEPAAVDSREK